MKNIRLPLFPWLRRIHSANPSGAEGARPVLASRWGNHRSRPLNVLAPVLLGLLWTAIPARADGGFPVRYTGVLTVLANGGVNQPFGVAVALDGTVYIADTYGQRIVKVTPSGTTSVFSISGITGGLSYPTQVAVDLAGNLYIADYGNNRIVKSDPSGNGTVVNTQSVTLSEPEGVAVDGSGDIFIADTVNNRIVEVAASGAASVLTGSGSYLTSLSGPTGVATDLFGNLYIADYGNNRIVKVTTSGAESLLSTNGSLNQPQSVSVDNTGMVYIADKGNHRVAIVNQQTGDTYDLLFNEVNSDLGSPSAIAVSAFGTVYIADSANGQVNVFQVNHAEFAHVTLGSSGTPQTLNFVVNETATLTGVAIYTSGTQNLDFTIAANSGTPCTTGSNEINCTVNVQFTPTSAGLRRGALVLSYTDTLFGIGTLMVPLSGIGDAPVAALSPAVGSVLNVGSVPVGEPFQTAYDGVGNIYVASYQNSTVSKIPAGGGSASTVTIPSLGTPSHLSNPTGLAIDGAGNLFISDYNNSRLVEVTPSGTSKVIAVRGLSPGFSFPTTLAFDLAGRLWVDDYGSGRIIVLSPDIYDNDNNDGDGTVGFAVAYVFPLGGYTLGSDNSIGVSVDLIGNVYFTDQDASPGLILKATPFGNVSPLSLPSVTLNAPAAVTVDPQGNIYVGDSGNERIIQLTTSGAVSVLKYTGPSLGQFAYGLAVDNSDNLLISDLINNRLIEVNVGQSALTFSSTLVDSTSTTKTTTVTNLGDQPLVFSANPTYTANFSQDTTDENPCTSDTSLATGQSCDVPIIFSPQSVGSLSANINATNDTQNVAGSTQQIAVSGTATVPSTTTRVTFAPTSSVYGGSVTIATTVSSSDGTPTGTVTITDLTTSTTLASNLTLISGVATVYTSTLGAGSHEIEAVYTPIGNFQSSNGSNTLTTTQASTSTVLQLSGSTLTAIVAAIAPDAGTPTGSVQFRNGTTVIGNGTLSGGTATLSLTVPSTYLFTAVYSGDNNFVSSTSGPVTKTSISTTTAVTFSPLSSTYGQSLTGSATVSATGVTPTGTVTFTDQTTSTTLAAGVNLSSGVATITLSTLGTGNHSIQAVYTPAGSFLTSSGSSTVTIVKAGTATALSLFGNTLTATVTATPPGAGTPTGTVQFLNGTTVLGNGTLSGGAATLALTIPPPYSLDAVYSGDANFSSSTSQAVVGYASGTSSLTLTSSPNPAQFGQSVTFTAILTTRGGPPSAAPTGSVQFSDGTKVLGSSGLSNGQATYTTTALTGGVHIITATYSGDARFPSASVTMGLMVSAPITMNITAAPSAPVYGQPVTLIVTVGVTSVPAAFSAPTGQVTFFLEGITPASPNTKLGTVTLASGAATLNLSTLPAGAVYIQSQYSGDSTWPPAYHQMELTISRAATTTSVSVAMNSGQLMLTGTVAPQPPGAGIPTGSVQFVDTSNDNAVVASAGLSAGTATAQVAASTVGSVEGHAIAAVYLGDSNFSPSTSAPLPEVANSAANVSATVAPDEIASLFGIPGLNGSVTATLPLGTSLDGVSVNITDSTGTTRPALLYAVSGAGGQINLVIPSGTATGPAVVSITLPSGAVVTTVINVINIAPAVYTVNDTGQGTYSGQVTYVHADGTQTVVQSATDAGNSFTPNPIHLGTLGDQVFLVLYATGLRHGSSVTATVNGVSVPVAFFGAQPANPGLDQINLGPLPASLAGAGQVNIVVTVDGQTANTVTAVIQ